MPGKLESLNFHVGAPGATPRAVAGPAHFRELNTLMGAPEHIAAFQTDEAAARHFLDTILRQDDRPGLRSLVAENVPELVPSLQLSRTRVHPHNDHRQLTFVQTASPSIRVFGSNVTVELRPSRELVSITAVLAETPNVSAVPSLTPQEALDAVKRFTNTSQLLSMVAPPTLYVYKDDQNRWRLTYLFQNVPAAPPEVAAEIQQKTISGHGLDLSPRDLQPEFNYLVDAHTSDVVFYYSAIPTLAPGGLPVPALCTGVGEGGKTLKFYGRQITGGFEMADGLRSIKTFDLKGGDVAAASLPPDPINNGSNNWATTRKDAVSAHANLERIFDFYNTVLFRDSVDDKRMQLNAVVNCYYSGHGPGPEWHNAVWWRNVMWFGQRSVPGGGSESYSKFLDVTAHELTHGVTQFTCGLVYRNQSGALNESVSDIFGIIIANCCEVSDQTVTGWNWEVGSGLASGGGPLRDFSDPARTGDPDAMSKYVVTTRDLGGVHTNSNIHNKAAYHVLTSVDLSGAAQFAPKEVALFYYLALTRLSSLAGFADMKQALCDVVNSYYIGSPAVAAAKVAAINDAYAKVGL